MKYRTGAWLQALPSPQLGTYSTNDEFRFALSLRIGLPIVQSHRCVCGEKVNRYALHGLSCSKAKVATETSGFFGKLGSDVINKIGSKIAEYTNENRARSYLMQRISIAIQKGNVASILGTIPPTADLREIFYL